MDNSISLLLSSSLAVAIVTALKELAVWVLNRKASKEDKNDKVTKDLKDLSVSDEKQDMTLKEISQQISDLKSSIDKNDIVTKKSLMILFGDRIRHVALSYIQKGEITFKDKEELTRMWECYHYDLGGNGTYDDLMEQIKHLKIVG